jgi:hypothetical protein
MNEPFLPPIEKPKALIMNLVYAMSRWQFGKVLTPVKVYAARMPNAFGTFFGKVSTAASGKNSRKKAQKAQKPQRDFVGFCLNPESYFAVDRLIWP